MKKLFTWKNILITLILLLVGGGIWYQKTKPAKVDYQSYKPEMRNLVATIEVSGKVDATEKADIPYGSGKIAWVGVKEDEAVKKYQTLATMDTSSLQKQLEVDLNNFSKQMRTRDNSLADVNYYNNLALSENARRTLENGTFDLRNSALQVEIRDLAIKMSRISSPIEGLITRLDKPFSGVNASVADVITVVNPKSIYFAAIVDETDVSKVEPGMSAKIELDAFNDQVIDTRVMQVDFSPSTSRSGGTGYKIHLPINQSEIASKLKLGMNGTVKLIMASKDNALSIPGDVIISRDGQNYVDILKNGKVERIMVTLGLETDEYVEVTSGITTSDTVVLVKKGK